MNLNQTPPIYARFSYIYFRSNFDACTSRYRRTSHAPLLVKTHPHARPSVVPCPASTTPLRRRTAGSPSRHSTGSTRRPCRGEAASGVPEEGTRYRGWTSRWRPPHVPPKSRRTVPRVSARPITLPRWPWSTRSYPRGVGRRETCPRAWVAPCGCHRSVALRCSEGLHALEPILVCRKFHSSCLRYCKSCDPV